MLSVDATIVGGSAGDTKSIEGKGDDGSATFVDGDRLSEGENFAIFILFNDARLVDEGGEGARGAIDDGWFRGVDFYDSVINGHTAEGGEDVFDRVEFDGVGSDRCFTFQLRDHFGDGADFGFTDNVGTAENETRVGGAWLDREGDLLAGVKGFAFDGGLFADGSLFHTYIQLFTPTIGCKALVEGVSGYGDMGIRGKAYNRED